MLLKNVYTYEVSVCTVCTVPIVKMDNSSAGSIC